MRAAALAVSVLLTLAAAAGAALVVARAPVQKLAFLAVVVDEKTWALALAAMVGAVLARLARSPAWLVAQLGLAVAIVGVSIVPVANAASLAARRHVALDYGRWLGAAVDTGAARPSATVVYAMVDGRPLALDVYRPSKPSGAAAGASVPAVVVVHGGGWSAGDKGEASLTSAALAARGYAVFDVAYRLAPPPTWQSAVGDVKCAIGWVKRRAAEAGVDVDPARVTLVGRSAGGHLALMAAYAPDDPALPPSCDAGDTRVAAVVSLYGFTDLAWSWANPGSPRNFDTRARVDNFLGGPPTELADRYRALSPAERVTARAPRTVLIHGGHDVIVPVDHVELLASRLRALGVPHDVLVIPHAQHAFDFVAGGLSGQLAEDAIARAVEGRP